MNYLTRVVDSHFRKNPDGSVVFHPWGLVGRGYVISEPERAARLRTFVRVHFLTTLAVFTGAGMMFRHRGLEMLGALMVLLLPGYIVGIRLILSGAPRNADGHSPQEYYASKAAGMSEKNLRQGFMAAVVFAAGGVFLLLFSHAFQDRLFGGITAVAAMVIAIVHRRMLRSKRPR